MRKKARWLRFLGVRKAGGCASFGKVHCTSMMLFDMKK